MPGTDRFPNLFIGEKKVLTFDFADELPSGVSLTGTPTVAVVVTSGTDAAPAELFNGAPGIVGDAVLVPVDPTVEAVEYRLKVLVATTDAQLVLACVGYLYIEQEP